MTLLLAGLAGFILVHLIPTAPALRARLIERVGRGGYMGLFSLASIVSLVLLVMGYRTAPYIAIWDPPAFLKHVNFVLLLGASILIVAAYVPSRIRTAVKHPMLASVKLWALGHLLVRGDLAALILFGGLLAWAIYDRISVKRRAALGPLGSATGRPVNDVIVIAGGLALYALIVFWFHPSVIGLAVVPG